MTLTVLLELFQKFRMMSDDGAIDDGDEPRGRLISGLREEVAQEEIRRRERTSGDLHGVL